MVVRLAVKAALRMFVAELPMASLVRYFETSAKLEVILRFLMLALLVKRNGHLIVRFSWHVCVNHWCCWACSRGSFGFGALR